MAGMLVRLTNNHCASQGLHTDSISYQKLPKETMKGELTLQQAIAGLGKDKGTHSCIDSLADSILAFFVCTRRSKMAVSSGTGSWHLSDAAEQTCIHLSPMDAIRKKSVL